MNLLNPGFLSGASIKNYARQFGVSPTIAASDAYFSGLLLFTWTSDPNPLHGIINRPIFDPILAGAFLAGLMGIAVSFYRQRDWRAGLLIAALLVGLLPQTGLLNPPLAYPSLLVAVFALPAAFLIAAWGLSRVVLLARDIWGLNGLRWALILFAVALFFIASDAHFHYTEVVIPFLERTLSTLQ